MHVTQANRIALYLALSLGGYILLYCDFLAYSSIQVMLSAFFIAGAVFEFKAAKHRFLVLPPAVFTVYCFLNVVLAGANYFLLGLKGDPRFVIQDFSVVRGTWYTMVAVQVLWTAFYLFPDVRIRLPIRGEITSIPRKLIYWLVGISLGAFLIGIKFGIYGYVASAENIAYLSYIRFAVNFGLLAIIFLVAYDYGDLKKRALLYGLIGLYFFVGLAFGSKSTAVVPMLLLIVSLYFTGRKIKSAYLAGAVLMIAAAYAIVEPFRIYYDRFGKEGTYENVYEMGQLFMDAQAVVDVDEKQYVGAFLERMSYVIPLATTIEFADNNGYYQKEEWLNLLFSPIYAVVPRLFWPSKPVYNFGVWASVNVFDLSENTATGITPQGYAYLVLRLAGILIFFVLAGLIQRFMFNLLFLNAGFTPFYILLYFDIGYPAVVPWTYVAGMIQALIFNLPVIALLIYLDRKQNAAASAPGPAPAH